MLPEHLKENAVVAALLAGGEDLVAAAGEALGELTIEVPAARILDALRILKKEKFERLSTVTAVDRYPVEPRFEVVYHLQSVSRNLYVRVKSRVSGDDPRIASSTAVYASANWYEREAWDLFGIVFEGHPNLTRIMMPEFWEGHPLRRDYPVHGHKYSYRNE